MNIERLELVKQAILNEANFFNMDFFFTFDDGSRPDVACGTAACIAGHAINLFTDNATEKVLAYRENHIWPFESVVESFSGYARKLLGLTDDQRYWLFYGEWRDSVDEAGDKDIGNITREEAVAAIDYLIAGNPVTQTDPKTGETSYVKVQF